MAKALEIVVTGLDKLVQKLAAYPTTAKAALGRGLKAGALVLVREVKETIYLGHAQDHLQGDKGLLRNSITYKVGSDEAEIGTNVIYAPIHEFGGTIRAKNAPYLVFQLPGYQTRSGKLTAFGKAAAEGAVDSGGNAVNATGWVSVKEVTIPPRPYLGPAIEHKGAEAAMQVTNALYEVLAP